MEQSRASARVWARHRDIPAVALAVVPAVVLAPVLAAGPVGPSSRACGLVLGSAALTSAVLLWTRWRITGSGGRTAAVLVVAALAALSLGAWAPSVIPDWSGAGVLTLGASVVAAALGLGASARAVHHAVEHEHDLKADLQRRLATAEDALRADQARRHEITATVAGIASAQELLTTGISGERSDALSAMMLAEVERLQRLVGGRVRTRRAVDLDEVIGQIVVSHLARGRVVDWQPSSLRALGRADDIAEVVNVLLDNAAVHGGPDAATVRVTRDPDHDAVVVTVADQGPGIAPDVRARLFDWGVSRPGSPGQGIGLHVAADLARELGGRLELVPSETGASFAFHLPAAVQEVIADASVARAS